MPRAIWSGAISFGLVTIPVRLYSAVSAKRVSFNNLDPATGSRVKQRWVSAADGSEVSRSDMIRGYEISKDNYVTITDEELESLDPEVSRSIDIVEFVDLDEIDPVFYASAYYLAPDELAAKAYKVLTMSLNEADKVGIARMVMRQKEYVAAVRPAGDYLMLSTMVYADEINAATGIDEFDKVEAATVTEAEIEMAKSLIDSLSAEFEPQKYEDTYRVRVLEMIERKAAGEETVIADAPAAVDDGKVVDLMAALEASVAAAKVARGRHPSAGGEEADEGDTEGETVEQVELAEVKPAKKATRKKATKKAAAKKSTRKKAAKKTSAKKATKKTAEKKTPARKSA